MALLGVARLDQPIGELFGRAWSWWLGELTRSLPERGRASGRGRRLVARIERGGTVLGVAHRGGFKPLSDQSLAHGAAERAARGRPIELQVAADQLLLKELRLPTAAMENLPAVIASEMDRETPFSADAVLFAHRARQRQDRTVLVDLAVLPRAIPDRVARDLSALGLSLGRVTVHDGVGWLARVDFSKTRIARDFRVPRGLVIALLLTALAPGAIQAWDAWRLDQDLVLAKAEADGALVLAERLRRKASGGSALDQEKAAAPNVSAMLAAVTETLPDAAWLDGLSLDGATVTLSGYAPAAAELIPLLERSGHFAAARFAGAVVRDPTRGLEHFQITATWTAGKR